MRILMVSRGVMSVGRSSGGAEFVAFELAGHLAHRGEEVVLVSDVDSSLLEKLPAKLLIAEVGTYRGAGRLVRLIPLEFPRWVAQHLLGNVRVARRAHAMLKSDEQGFDIIHVHGALAAILLRRALRTHAERIPLVYTEHDSTPWSCRYRRRFERSVRRFVYRGVNLRACRAATAIIANFPSLADELAARAGIPRSRFTTVSNAAAAGWLSGEHGAEIVRTRHGFDRYCLFVGSLIDRKGPDVLLHALSDVRLPCIFVGDGPMRASLERLAERAGIADRVVFTGALERSELRSYYLGAEALVLPSVSEGVPLVAIEALGIGVPVVASNLTGIASVVQHHENGLLIEPGDKVSLARALSVFENDAATRVKLRLGAKRSGHGVATWSDVVNQLCALYARHRPARPETPAAGEAMAELSAADLQIVDDLTHPSQTTVAASEPGQAARV